MYRRGNFSIWDFYKNKPLVKGIKTKHFSQLWSTNAIVLGTFSDATKGLLNYTLYGDQLKEMGILPANARPMRNVQLGIAFRKAILPLIMNPHEELCEGINRHIADLKQRGVIIGVQMRLGGKKANYKERLFLGPNSVKVFASKVLTYAQSHGLNSTNSVVFVSTDSTFALNKLTTILNDHSPGWVYSVSEWEIGHSAPGKVMAYGDKKRTSFMNRAISDILLLKESDYLVFSQGSSYGLLAAELQQAYGYSVNAYDYVRTQGLKCSVFHRRKTVGSSTFVSKYFAKKNVKKSVKWMCLLYPKIRVLSHSVCTGEGISKDEAGAVPLLRVLPLLLCSTPNLFPSLYCVLSRSL